MGRRIGAILSRAAREIGDAIAEGRDQIAAVHEASRQIVRVLAPAMIVMADTGARQVQDAVGELEQKRADAFAEERVRWAREHAAKRVSKVSDTTREMIRRQVERAARQNMPPRQLGDEIAKALGGEVSRSRAMRIARTELHQAATWGQLSEALRFQRERGQAFVKVWRATRDARTRHAHRLADGQARPINEAFTVGGAQLMRPGDPTAPPSQTVNCRCTQTIVPAKAAATRGQPVVRRLSDGRLRASLGQHDLQGRPLARALELERGGEMPGDVAERMYRTMASEALPNGRALLAPRGMTAAERSAFEALGRQPGVRLLTAPGLQPGAIGIAPQPPMVLQVVSEVDDLLTYRDLIAQLMEGIGAQQ